MTNSVLHLLVFEIVICWHKFEMSIKYDDHVYISYIVHNIHTIIHTHMNNI